MGLKQYILGAVIFAAAVGGYTYSIIPDAYTLNVLEKSIALPIAVWVVAPIGVFFVLSVIHMTFYGMKKYLYIRSLNKDEQTLVELVSDILLKKEAKKSFKTDPYKEISLVLSQLNLSIKDSNFHSNVKELTDVADKVVQINKGIYINSKELKLPNDNELMQKNLMNKIANDDSYALEVIKDPEKHGENVVKAAFLKVLDARELASVKKHLPNLKFDKEMVLSLLKKDSEETTSVALSNDAIIENIKKVKFDTSDYITIIEQYKIRMLPDQIIKLLEDLSTESDEATEAYLYVLFEYEMLDDARAIINASAPNDYKPYKALLDLKDAGKHYNFDHTAFLK